MLKKSLFIDQTRAGYLVFFWGNTMHNEIKPNVSVHWTHRDTVIYKVIILLSPIVIFLLRPAGGKETGTCPLTVVHVAHRP